MEWKEGRVSWAKTEAPRWNKPGFVKRKTWEEVSFQEGFRAGPGLVGHLAEVGFGGEGAGGPGDGFELMGGVVTKRCAGEVSSAQMEMRLGAWSGCGKWSDVEEFRS